ETVVPRWGYRSLPRSRRPTSVYSSAGLLESSYRFGDLVDGEIPMCHEPYVSGQRHGPYPVLAQGLHRQLWFVDPSEDDIGLGFGYIPTEFAETRSQGGCFVMVFGKLVDPVECKQTGRRQYSCLADAASQHFA